MVHVYPYLLSCIIQAAQERESQHLMKRRSFLRTSATGALASVPMLAHAQGAGDHSAPIMASPPVVMAPRADGAEIVWAVSRLCRGWVECRTADGKVRKIAVDDFGFTPQSSRIMRVRLSGLPPGEAFDIRAVVETVDSPATREESPWKPMRTLHSGADTTHFVIWNDTHENAETLRRLHQITPAADFLIWNGDTCNDWHREEQLVPVLLNPGGQDITAGRPMFLAMGNHDVRGKFGFKMSELIAMPDGRPLCAFRSGPVACLLLNTGEDTPDSHPGFHGRVAFEHHRREQAEWIRTATATPEIRDAPHKVVFCHIPLRWTEEAETVDYAGGQWDRYARSSRDLWHDALVNWGAQVVFSGHTHRDAWIPANNHFPYAQMTGGGPQPDRATWIECTTGAAGLRVVMHNLNGEIIHDVTLPTA